MTRTYDIAVIPGDGIGKEVVPEGVRVLEAAAKKFGFELQPGLVRLRLLRLLRQARRMMPEDWKEQIGAHDAIFFGAVGWPAKSRTTSRCGARCSCSAASSTSTSICARCG